MREHLLNWLGRRRRRLTSSPAVGRFLAGYSVSSISAVLNPGLGGPALIDAQRDSEDAIRNYITAGAGDRSPAPATHGRDHPCI